MTPAQHAELNRLIERLVEHPDVSTDPILVELLRGLHLLQAAIEPGVMFRNTVRRITRANTRRRCAAEIRKLIVHHGRSPGHVALEAAARMLEGS